MLWRLQHLLVDLKWSLKRRKWMIVSAAALVLCGLSVGFLWWLGGQPAFLPGRPASLSPEETASMADSGVVVRCDKGELVYKSDARGGKKVALSPAPGTVVQRGGRLLKGLPQIPEGTHILVLASGDRLFAVYWEKW